MSSSKPSSRTNTSGRNWRALVQQRAAAAGVELPAATIDELALHVDDLYAAARADGLDDDAAVARAVAALDESRFTVLQRHAMRATPPATTSFNVAGAIRLAIRQFRQH